MEPLTTVEYADEFFAKRLNTDVWDAASLELKEKAIQSASDLIRANFVFSETASYVDEKGDVKFVEPVQNAACYQAKYMLATDPYTYPELLTKGFSSATAGPLSVTADKSFVPNLLSGEVEQEIGEFGEFIGDTGKGTIKSYFITI